MRYAIVPTKMTYGWCFNNTHRFLLVLALTLVPLDCQSKGEKVQPQLFESLRMLFGEREQMCWQSRNASLSPRGCVNACTPWLSSLTKTCQSKRKKRQPLLFEKPAVQTADDFGEREQMCSQDTTLMITSLRSKKKRTSMYTQQSNSIRKPSSVNYLWNWWCK